MTITPHVTIPDPLSSLEGKTALVTGGTRGIGAAIAAQLTALGCSVLTLARRHADIDCDVANAWQVWEVACEAEGVDILVNCAGYISPATVVESSLYSWRRHLAVNLIGPFLLCHNLVPHMPPDGVVVNIASSAAHQGKAGWSAYCASKAALVSFTESLAAEGVRAYCVSPGRTDTMMRHDLYPDEDKSTLLAPEDVARLVVYLCCPDHDLEPGQTFRIAKER